jgi:outer membrane lipoprotein SlyB
MKKVRAAQVAALVIASALATGCANSSLTGTAYSQADARKVQTIRYGTVTSVTPVVIEGRKDGVVGTGAGAIVGGIAGSTVGGGRGSSIATVLGAVAGGMIGSKIEENTTRKQGQEVQIRLANGQEISVVQEVEDQRFFQVGDQVRLLEGRGATRITY